MKKSSFSVLKEAGFPTASQAPTVFGAAVAAAREEIDAQNLHFLVSPDGRLARVCGRDSWNPAGDVSLVRDKIAMGWAWKPVDENYKDTAAEQMVIDVINTHWVMINADFMIEAMGLTIPSRPTTVIMRAGNPPGRN